MSCQPSQEEKKVTGYEKSRKQNHDDPASMRTHIFPRRMYRVTSISCSEFPMDASLQIRLLVYVRGDIFLSK